MFLKKIFIALVFIASAIVVRAQNKSDYVIMSSGDTVYCKIGSTFFNSTLKYKTDEMKSAVPIDPVKLKSYYLEKRNEVYVSVLAPEQRKPEFMRLVEDGQIKLYEQVNNVPNMSSVSIWFISKNFGPIEKLKIDGVLLGSKMGSRKSREELLSEIIQDKPNVYEKYLANKKFTNENIKSVVHFYNTGVWIEAKKYFEDM